MLFHGIKKALLIHFESLFSQDVAADLEGEAESGIQVEGIRSGKSVLASLFQFLNQAVELQAAGIQGLRETLFFAGKVFCNQFLTAFQFGVSLAIIGDDN